MGAICSNISSVDIVDANEAEGEEVRGVAVSEHDNNHDHDDDGEMAADTDNVDGEMAADTDNDDDDDDDDDDDEEEEEGGEEEPIIPTPEEVELEYTYPNDFIGRRWRDVVRRDAITRRHHYFRLLIDPSCTKISDDAFMDCPFLIVIVFAENSYLTEIGVRAFASCINLQRMNAFPVGLVRLRRGAYMECMSLSGVLVIPCTVVLVDQYCFGGCGCVTSVIFHDNSTPADNPVELGWCVFADCRELQSAQLPQNIVLIPRYAFFRCTSLVNIQIPVSVEEIGSESFLLCSALQSIDLPERTIQIGHQAFRMCTSLAKVTIRAKEVLYCGQKVFNDCAELATIQVYPSVWMKLFEAMNEDPSFLFHFIRKYQSWK